MKLAVMQPYIFPYIGYFQLINAVDKFVFYDDVNFIKRGWINRNQILINKNAHLFTIPLIKASQNKLILEIELGIDEKWIATFLATLEFNYKNAPNFDEIFNLIQTIFSKQNRTIADLTIESITTISKYLGLLTQFEKSSISYASSKGMEKADRLIDITKKSNSNTYINPNGGKDLYTKAYFNKQGINLFFIENSILPYSQYKNEFISGLSIIDVLMFNSKENIKHMLTKYTLT